jgi:hypothetical protein
MFRVAVEDSVHIFEFEFFTACWNTVEWFACTLWWKSRLRVLVYWLFAYKIPRVDMREFHKIVTRFY